MHELKTFFKRRSWRNHINNPLRRRIDETPIKLTERVVLYKQGIDVLRESKNIKYWCEIHKNASFMFGNSFSVFQCFTASVYFQYFQHFQFPSLGDTITRRFVVLCLSRLHARFLHKHINEQKYGDFENVKDVLRRTAYLLLHDFFIEICLREWWVGFYVFMVIEVNCWGVGLLI